MKKKFKLINIGMVLLLSYAVFSLASQQVTMHKIREQTKASEQELLTVEQNNQKLQDEVKMANTDMYIEKLAREKLGLIKEGETPVINTEGTQ